MVCYILENGVVRENCDTDIADRKTYPTACIVVIVDGIVTLIEFQFAQMCLQLPFVVSHVKGFQYNFDWFNFQSVPQADLLSHINLVICMVSVDVEVERTCLVDVLVFEPFVKLSSHPTLFEIHGGHAGYV